MIDQPISHYRSDPKMLARLWSDDLIVTKPLNKSYIRFLRSQRKSIVHVTSQSER
jgi:hypothetical protein